MKITLLTLACVLFILLPDRCYANLYVGNGDEEAERVGGEDGSVGLDYSDNTLDRLLYAAQQKRACVRRGGNCDHRPNDCCWNSSCRCNLWGSNCRCQRMGLFQKWG